VMVMSLFAFPTTSNGKDIWFLASLKIPGTVVLHYPPKLYTETCHHKTVNSSSNNIFVCTQARLDHRFFLNWNNGPLLRICCPFHINSPIQKGKKTRGKIAYTMYGTLAPPGMAIHCGV